MAPITMKRRGLDREPMDIDKPDHLDVDEGRYTTVAASLRDREGRDGALLRTDPLSSAREHHASKTQPSPVRHTWRTSNSDVFRLQANELLANVRPDYDRRISMVDTTLRSLKAIIEAIPDHGPLSLREAQIGFSPKRNVSIPFPRPAPDGHAKHLFSYAKPISINVVGSYAHRTITRDTDDGIIDLAVTMPPGIFDSKDYLDYRYFHKRAYYLSCIAASIKEHNNKKFVARYTYQNDNHLLPAILVQSVDNQFDCSLEDTRITIMVLLAADQHLFPTTKVLPTSSCIRLRSENMSPQKPRVDATPFYNSSIRSELCSLAYLRLLAATSSRSEAFGDACMLGSIWLRRRGLAGGMLSGGYGSFEWACTMALLFQGGGVHDMPVLSPNYNSLQLFKATLQFLADTNLELSPISIQSERLHVHQQHGPILFDGVRGLNILYKMTAWSYAMLRCESKRTLELFHDPVADQFDACFIIKIDEPIQRFDLALTFPGISSSGIDAPSLDAYDGLMKTLIHIHEILKRGLDDRIHLLSLTARPLPPWDLTDMPESCSKLPAQVLIGLILDPDRASRNIDKGPPAEEKEAAASFRTFWREKAELRRFKDGSILESVIWTLSRLEPSILMQIIKHLVRSHISADIQPQILDLSASFMRAYASFLTTEHPSALYQPVLSAFKTFETQIRNLQGLPLQIRHISGADPQLRCSSSKTSLPQCPISIHIQFEGSNRWPDNFLAVQRTKIAFLLKIGELMKQSKPPLILSAQLGLESSFDGGGRRPYLDINHSPKIVFRLRLSYEREQELLDKHLKVLSRRVKDHESNSAIVSAYRRDFIQAPLHTQAVQSLSTRFTLLAASMRLMKSWRDSHLLSGDLSDEFIELLTIRTFVQPQPWGIPGSVLTAFLRTLTFISRWDWQREPLIVSLSQKLEPIDIRAISIRFAAWRKIDPAMSRMTVFAASNLDFSGSTWTELGPSRVVAIRLTRLARAACAAAKKSKGVHAEALFTSSLDIYDFVVRLNRMFVDSISTKVSRRDHFRNPSSRTHHSESLTNFNPMRMFLAELRRLYGTHVLFLHDASRASVIAGIWKPHTGPNVWRVNTDYPSKPTRTMGHSDGFITLNKSSILHDIARLGGSMISCIDVK